jgi:hypothetical protein
MVGRPSGERLRHAQTDDAGSNSARMETTMAKLAFVSDRETRGSVAIDLAGRTFARLTAIERAGIDERGKATWKGVCDCGNAAVIVGYILGVALPNVSDRPTTGLRLSR